MNALFHRSTWPSGRSTQAGRIRVLFGSFLFVFLSISGTALAQTNVTRVSPSELQISAGGDAASLTIAGSNLNAVTGVRVMRNRRPATGVEAELGRPARNDPRVLRAQLTVSISAEATAPSGDYGLQLIAGRAVIDVPVSIEVVAAQSSTPQPSDTPQLILRPVPAPLPAPVNPPDEPDPPDVDLLVESWTLRDQTRFGLISPTAGNRIRVIAEVSNILGQNAPDMAFVCRRRSGPGGGALQDTVSVRTGPFGPNETKTITLNISGPEASGPGHMSCIIDDGNEVLESDESNNEVGTTFTSNPTLPQDFSLEIRDIQPWTTGSRGHRTLRFEVANMGPRGAVNPPPANEVRRLRWQAECVMPQRPLTRVRSENNMTLYAGGELPEPGVPQQASMWLSPIDISPMPPVSGLPAELLMNCTLRVGAFMPNVPVVHAGDDVPQPDWGAPQVWWSRTVILNIPNPESSQYTPPQDISVSSVSGSASQTSDQAVRSDLPAFARFSVNLNKSESSLRVDCSAARPGAATINRSVTLSNTGTSASGTVRLGTLEEGTWTLRCEADSNESLEDSNRVNNVRSAQMEVLAPGVDLLVESWTLRDQTRFGLISPTAGNRIRVIAEVSNILGQNAPDMAFVCRRRSGPGGGALQDTVSVRTGPFGPNETKTITLNISGPEASGPGHMSCIIDDGNEVLESDESNNEVGTTFTSNPTLPQDFSLEIRDIQPWTTGSRGHRTLRFEVANMGPRGAVNPPPANEVRRLRWQAECVMPQRPLTRVRSENNMTLYAGGELPEPGVPQQASMWLSPIDISPMPPVSGLPAELLMNCTLRVGAFMPNVPVVHAGDDVPQPDWGAPQVWWSRTVILSIPNPESNSR